MSKKDTSKTRSVSTQTKPVKRRAARKSKPVTKIKNPLLQKLVELDDKQKDRISGTVRAMLNVSMKTDETWRGLFCVPPNSFLDLIIQAFYNRTDIPLETPFFTGLSYIAAYLLKNDVVVKFDGQVIKPSLWTVVLASSGTGKTFSHSRISSFINEKADFPECSSSAKFVDELANHNNGFWLRDEFAQLLKALDEQPHMAEIRDILLRLYDGNKIERSTKKDEVIVENPALVILGITVLETFMDNVSLESLTDGFSQRFMYAIARRDPERHLKHALYEINDYKEPVANAWEDVKASVKHKEYKLGKDAKKAFESAFDFLVPINNLPASFFRRIMFTGIKYALIYHVILGKKTKVIDAVDMGWAARVCSLHIKDSMELLEGHDKSELQRIIVKCDEAIAKMELKGKTVNARHLAQAVREITSAQMANAMLYLCGYGPSYNSHNQRHGRDANKDD